MTGTGRAMARTPDSAHNAPTNLPAKQAKTHFNQKALNLPNTEAASPVSFARNLGLKLAREHLNLNLFNTLVQTNTSYSATSPIKTRGSDYA